jgi:hypothetical protein
VDFLTIREKAFSSPLLGAAQAIQDAQASGQSELAASEG